MSQNIKFFSNSLYLKLYIYLWLLKLSCCLHFLSFFFFNFTILYWFCHTSTCIHHGCTRVPILNAPPISLPIPSLQVIPVHQPQASCILHRTWTGYSFLIWYTCFNAIVPKHPPPPQSPKDCSIDLCLLLFRIQGCCYHLSKFL